MQPAQLDVLDSFRSLKAPLIEKGFIQRFPAGRLDHQATESVMPFFLDGQFHPHGNNTSTDLSFIAQSGSILKRNFGGQPTPRTKQSP
jgi:hypothetical protein